MLKERMDVVWALKERYKLFVMVQNVPTPQQFEALERWVDWANAAEGTGYPDYNPDEVEAVFAANEPVVMMHEEDYLGWCPLHDPKRDGEHSAAYDFRKGTVTCLSHPSCFAQPGRRERRCFVCEEIHSMVDSVSISTFMTIVAAHHLTHCV